MRVPKNFVPSDKFKTRFNSWIGVTVNDLTIIDFPGHITRPDSNTSVSPAVGVRCSCKKEFITFFYRVRNGKTPSCGHINTYYKTGEHSACHDLMNRYKHSAKTRNLTFELSYEDFHTLVKQPCHYCGVEATQVRTCYKCKAPCFYNGVDRINSDLGYVTTNTVPCCKVCNRAKSDMDYAEFIEYLNRIKSSPHLNHRDVSVKPKLTDSKYGNTESADDRSVFVEHSSCALTEAITLPRAPETP